MDIPAFFPAILTNSGFCTDDVPGLAGCGAKKDTESPKDNSSGNVVYRTVDEIKESGEINIGVFSDKSPFGYVDENGEYQGYDVYFGNRIGEDLGVKINYVSTEAANRIEYLQTGKVDIILANFTVYYIKQPFQAVLCKKRNGGSFKKCVSDHFSK